MEKAIRQFLKDSDLLQIIDIDLPQHSDLLKKYNTLVPVLFF